jgi:threonine/homoserine/homoserine lactone efflux protein
MVTESLLFGIIVGLAAGLSPGPLTTLVLSETLKNGKREGIQVAISPLVSESPIILFVLVILSRVAEDYTVIGAISMLGACFLFYSGLSNLTTKTKESKEGLGKDNALLRGVTTNLLNPNAYLFWLTIGGPRIMESVQTDISAAILFVIGFYMTLVGSKMAIAIVVDKSKTLVSSKYYVHIVRALGIVLIAFALIFVRDALELFGIL